ncbi:hypothetical protein [Natronomonas sp.]|uniref:hypothetical protein n=1 Tax=Natronomonas sp. TaxID=2184060 RepID=UPI00260C037F|nr:hypothetical protein [Natronomonas sp.]
MTVGRGRTDSGVRIEIADDGPGISNDQWGVITSGEETPLKHSTGIGRWSIHWTETALGGTRLVLTILTGTDDRAER